MYITTRRRNLHDKGCVASSTEVSTEWWCPPREDCLVQKTRLVCRRSRDTKIVFANPSISFSASIRYLAGGGRPLLHLRFFPLISCAFVFVLFLRVKLSFYSFSSKTHDLGGKLCRADVLCSVSSLLFLPFLRSIADGVEVTAGRS